MEGILSCFLAPLAKLIWSGIKKIKCPQDVAIVAPHYSGKSFFVNSVSSKKFALLDLEENVRLHLSKEEKELLASLNNNSSYNLHYFPVVKKYLQQIKKDHKGKNLIIFSSNYELLEFCGIKNIMSFVPSNELSNNIKLTLDEDKKKQFDSSRVDLMLKAGDNLISFNSFDDFGKQIINKFKLQAKL